MEVQNIIPIKISFLSPFSELSDQMEFKIEMPSGSKVKDLFEALSKKFGKKFNEYLYQNDHQFSKEIVILRNGKNITLGGEKILSEPLEADQEFVFCTFLDMG
ncbi:MAG: hypothetical protein ACTSO9_00710 [Candidatus Helarchaeota archaeon]